MNCHFKFAALQSVSEEYKLNALKIDYFKIVN